MIKSRRLREKLRLVAYIALASALGGCIFGLLLTGMKPLGLVRGALDGLFIASAIVAFEVFYFQAGAGRNLRRRAVWVQFLVKACAYTVLIVVGDTLAALVLAGTSAGALPALRIEFLYVLLFSLCAASVSNFVLMMNRMLGGRVLASFLTGRYHAPREEERILLFIDLVGSTGIAERIGHRAFHAFLNEVVFDLTDPIIENGGEIYGYVGDEVIATWPLGEAPDNGRAVACYRDIVASLHRRRGTYKNRHGEKPEIRAAIHAGPVVVGEMGDWKREITILGDVVNATARIEQACRELAEPCLISEALLEQTRLPAGVSTADKGVVTLRGRQERMRLFAVRTNHGDATGGKPEMSAHDFEIETIEGETLALSSFRGQPVLLVNTASECGFTPQYAELEDLWRDYRDRGLVVLGVPSNDFGGQEPGDESEIRDFCTSNYSVSFPMTVKQKVIGGEAHPLYRWIAAEVGEDMAPKWNFHKYLLDTNGNLVGAWPSRVKPKDPEITEAIDAAIDG